MCDGCQKCFLNAECIRCKRFFYHFPCPNRTQIEKPLFCENCFFIKINMNDGNMVRIISIKIQLF